MKLAVILAVMIAASNARMFVAPTTDLVTAQPQDDHCMALVLQIAMEIPELINAIQSGDISTAEKIAIDLVHKIEEVIKCFHGVGIVSAFDGLMSFAPRDRKDCIYRHARLALQDLKVALNDLVNLDFDGFQQEINSVVAVLQDAYKNC